MEKNGSNNNNSNDSSATWESGDLQSSLEVETTESNKNPTGDASACSQLLFEFEPGQMASKIRRRAMIKQLAASYHAECLSYCQELLELQRRWEQGK